MSFKKIVESSIWILLSNILSKLVLFSINIFAARILSQNEFGQYTTIRSSVALIENILNKSIGVSAIKSIAENSIENKDKAYTEITNIMLLNLFICLLVGIILYFSTSYLVRIKLVSFEETREVAFICFFLLIFNSFSTLLQNFIVGLKKTKLLGKTSLISSIIAFPLMLLFTYKFKRDGVFLGLIIFYIIDCIIKANSIKLHDILRKNKLSKRDLLKTLDKIIKISFFPFLAVVINAFVFWWARIILIKNSGNFEDIAIFDAAYQWLSMIMLITNATTMAAIPMLSSSLKKGNSKSINIIFHNSLIFNLAIALSISLVFILFSELIMGLYGDSYLIGSKTLKILSISSIFFTLATLYNRYMISIGKSHTLLVASMIGTCALYVTYYTNGITTYSLSISILMYYLSSVAYYALYKKLLS